MPRLALSPWLLALAVPVLALAACSVSPSNAVYDFAAIHDGQWRPRSPAQLTTDPQVYLGSGKDTPDFRVGEMESFEIADHRAVERGILQRIAAIPPSDVGVALEAAAYLMVALLHDDFADTRLQSAAVLSQFAAFWIERVGARPAAQPPQGDLAAAVAAYDAATAAARAPDYAARVGAALEQVDQARIDDPTAAALLLAGMARRYRTAPQPVTGDAVLQRTGVRAVLLALEHGEADPDPEVAAACRERRALILKHLAAPQP
ncbi:MAG: hypothetical protein EYC70_03620 [Planctomycetota bacterium]|nr:MAG: hypothetical protein EYC70_03620 [Planctomycetota bacterium]